MTVPPNHPSSVQKLQRELHQTRILCFGYVVIQPWRADIAIWQAIVRVVQEVKQLGAELKLLAFRNTNALEG